MALMKSVESGDFIDSCIQKYFPTDRKYEHDWGHKMVLSSVLIGCYQSYSGNSCLFSQSHYAFLAFLTHMSQLCHSHPE